MHLCCSKPFHFKTVCVNLADDIDEEIDDVEKAIDIIINDYTYNR